MADSPSQEEIAFASRLTAAEVRRMKALLGAASDPVTDPRVSAQHTLAMELGRLSARVMLIEEAVERQLLLVDQSMKRGARENRESSAMEIDQFHDYDDFHDIETSPTGLRFAWTKETAFSVRLAKNQNDRFRFVHIYFIAIAMQSYARSLNVNIGGQGVGHRVCKCGNQLVVEAAIPPSVGEGVDIELVLPSVHQLAPNNDNSADWREAGIAITRVALSERSQASPLQRLLT